MSVNSKLSIKFNLSDLASIKYPFDTKDLNSFKSFLEEVDSIELLVNNMRSNIYYLQGNEKDYYCFNWNLIFQFQSYSKSYFKSNFYSDFNFCSENHTDDYGHGNFFIDAVVLILSLISSILSAKYVFRSSKKYTKFFLLYKKARIISEQREVI